MKRTLTFSEAMRTRAEDVKRRRYTVVPSSWDPYTWESSNAMTFMEAMRTRADDVRRRRFSGVGWGDLPHEVMRLIFRLRRRRRVQERHEARLQQGARALRGELP